MTRRSSLRLLAFASLALLLCASALPLAAQRPARPARVLLLYQQQAETKPMLEFTERLRTTIEKELKSPVEFYQESLDLDRVTGRENSSSLARYFDDKYRRLGVDVVVPVGARALRFAVTHLDAVLPDVPVVFALCVAPQVDPTALPPNVTGRLAPPSRFIPTLWLARQLQPDAERYVVIGGAGTPDSTSVAAAVRAVDAMNASGHPLPLTVLQGMSLDALLPKLRQLSPRSIVVFANYRMDDQGRAFEPMDIVGTLAHAAPAPMYAQVASYVGEGVLGGSVLGFGDEGARTGELVLRVLRRSAGAPVPRVETTRNTFVVDWRQLRRFDLSESAVPPAARLLFREPTAWQRYHTAVLVTLGVVVVESMLIGTLLLERRRRRRAQAMAEEQQRSADETRRQVAHMGRVALIGELTAAIAHELRQPLAAIRANAETGAKLIRRHAGPLAEQERELCDEIFSAIVSDDALASDIVTRVRALVRREALPQQPVDLNEICAASVRLYRQEVRARAAEVTLSLDPLLPAVTGDPVQFQQVVLNLVSNALDASGVSSTPQVLITTVDHGETVEISVSDNGHGIPRDAHERLFESFFTTKTHGLGLGLVIVKSIVERHHGKVSADNGESGGAVFRVVLPATPLPRIAASEAVLESVAVEPSMAG